MTQGERIMALEVEVRGLKEQNQLIINQLNDLLALRNKGAGVFWLATSLMGAGLFGAIVQFVNWIK